MLFVSHLGPLWDNSSGQFTASVLLRLLTVETAHLCPPPNLALGSCSLGFLLGSSLHVLTVPWAEPEIPADPSTSRSRWGPETGFPSPQCTDNSTVCLSSPPTSAPLPPNVLCTRCRTGIFSNLKLQNATLFSRQRVFPHLSNHTSSTWLLNTSPAASPGTYFQYPQT